MEKYILYKNNNNNDNNNGPPWGLYCFLYIITFYNFTVHADTDIEADDVGNFFSRAGRDSILGPRSILWFFLISLLLQNRLPFVELHCLGPVTFAQVFADPHALANPVGSHIWISQGQ